MRTYRKNNKIIFKIGEDSSAIIEKILEILKDLIKISENRHAAPFPIDILKIFIGLCNSLIDSIENKLVPKKYIEYVNENKESLGYFKEIENKINTSKDVLEKKKNVYESFKDNVSSFINIL